MLVVVGVLGGDIVDSTLGIEGDCALEARAESIAWAFGLDIIAESIVAEIVGTEVTGVEDDPIIEPPVD